MKYFTATSNIKAPKETIWTLLTTTSAFPTWDPGVIRIEGTIAPGEKVIAYNKIAPHRAFPATVSEFVPNQKMAWTGGMPLGLFKGVRTFTLMPKADGSIDLTIREEFTGLLLPIIGGTIPDMNEAFQQAAAGLKARAEQG